MIRNERDVRVGFTPDTDDAFNFFGLVGGHVATPGLSLRYEQHCIRELNLKALRGELEVTAVSTAFVPALAERFWILGSGASVGRGYGPVLVARRPCSLGDLAGKRVGVPGFGTTGATLLRMLAPTVEALEFPFDEVGDAVATGEVDAGVMIHEELLRFADRGLRRVADLGALWCERTGGPLPVGVNVVSRSLGRAAAGRICAHLVDSFDYATSHQEEAMRFARGFAAAGDPAHTDKFVSMFSNDDTRLMPDDVRAAIPRLFAAMCASGIHSRVPEVEIIDPCHEVQFA